ncbi:HutD family protein [Mitsuaria sp. WAJ17]|uniref:HutD/Ves family protein n=1 Tax=Mitsuaria sp. WAJ17 TaxID=2761452 RepID=UPI001603C0FC|nr:HutD family protein [Mitsuaria sp. WAJ17]MBB2484344.1 HutD family protein [Mitsuaria sp. WAJ17]
MSWSILCADDVNPQRWKNNGGWTRELLAWPHAADWILRLSVADIEADGPFSTFEGVDRWFAVLRGEGVCLYDYELRPGDELLHFDGALGPDCTLLGGLTRDFNLMHRRGRGRMSVTPASEALEPVGHWVGMFTGHGGVLEHGGRAMALRPMSLAWCESPVAQRCVFKGGRSGEGQAWWMQWSDEA